MDYLLWIHSHLQGLGDQTTPARDTLMVGYFEQIINGLVYELFFSEELHAARLHPFKLFEEAKLPMIEDISESRRLPVLRETFEQVYDVSHPIRGCLFSLRSLEPVRIIEER